MEQIGWLEIFLKEDLYPYTCFIVEGNVVSPTQDSGALKG
jgi:hypothetical protein